jgi:hypothetical protein
VNAPPSDRATAPVFRTTDSNLSQFLIFMGRRGRCEIDTEGIPVFTFADSTELHGHVDAYLRGAVVPAVSYAEAGRIVRRLLVGARRQRAEYGSTQPAVPVRANEDGR